MSISNPCGNKIIFHYGNLAGLPHSLAKALRNIGQNAISIMPSASDTGGIGIGIANRQLPTDEVLVRQNDRAIVKLFKKLALVIRIIRNGALVHYHGATILPGAIDARIFRLCHIPMIISWGGGDARIIAEACRINQYFYRYDEPEKTGAYVQC